MRVEPIRNKRDIEKIKKALGGNPRDRFLFICGINMGYRISDLLTLTVGDLIDKNGKPNDFLTLKEGKTGKIRTVKINKAIKDEIKALDLDPSKPNDLVFISRKVNGKGEKRQITRVQAYRIFNDAAERAKLNINIGTHTLRKTFGYHAYKQGQDITLLMSVFGHATPKQTLDYIGITRESINAVYDSLDL